MTANTSPNIPVTHPTAKTGSLCSVLAIIILLVMLFLHSVDGNIPFNGITFLFLLNGCFGIVMLWVSMADAPYSLKQVHWVFYATFFAISPLIQYRRGVWPWSVAPSDAQVLQVCILVLAWGIIFAFASGRTSCVSKKHDAGNLDWLSAKMIFTLTPVARVILPVGCAFCLLALINLIGFNSLFLRTTSHIDVDSTSLSLVLSVCLRAYIFGSFALLMLNARREKKYYGGAIFAGICLLLTCFPTSLARFNIAAIYLGIAILLMPSFSTKRGLFALILIIGFIIIYPTFDAFKYIGSSSYNTNAIEAISRSITASYSSGNYDAFSIMFWCSKYIEMYGITYGNQLLGSVLFFIPRSIWLNKPVPSGELVFESLNFHFTDIAFPLPFEGYLNFGLIGLLLFAFIYGAIVRKLDNAYWLGRMRNAGGLPTTLLLYYPFLLCLTFYMLRGAMMTTFTYVFGDLAVMAFLNMISRMIVRREMAKVSSG